jgi:glycosyltransferase involved in cell wall biosynthesis
VPATAVILKGYPRLSETFIAQELLGLERAGHRLVLFSMRHPTDVKSHPVHAEIQAPVIYLPEYIHHEPARFIRSISRVAWRGGFWRALAAWIADFVREPTRNRARRFGQACVLAAELPRDVMRLYAHFIHTPATVTRYASLMTAKPWSCSAHAKDIWTSPDWDLRKSLASANWVTTCTEAGHRHLQSLAPRPASVHLVHHGLDLDRFPAAATPASTRDGTDRGNPVRLLSVGRAVPKKGFDTLLRSLGTLPPDLSWVWTHIGGGPERASLERLASELGLEDRVAWLGTRDQNEVLAEYRKSDIFVLPCRITDDGDRDGLPNVLVEAQSQGLACISTPISGIPELIEDGVNGRLVPANEPHALAAAIEQLSRDPEQRISMGTTGAARVRDDFDFRRAIAKLDRIFRLPDETGTTDEDTTAEPATAAAMARRARTG